MMYALLLHFAAPLQAWGTDSLFQERGAGIAPSLSAVCGMVCAADGADKGSDEEARIIAGFRAARMHSAALGDAPSRAPLCDFHTVLGTRAVNGSPLPTVVTRRFYRQDERYGVLLESTDRDFGTPSVFMTTPGSQRFVTAKRYRLPFRGYFCYS